MAKPDMTRDYYADLGLPPSADVNEIKKQFRKLALLYHPDRNPGREAEVNSKFQTIQSAHEVLTTADSKAKYDAHRARSSYPKASGVTGNPWQDAHKAYPPPPRRTNRPTPSSRRYADFAANAAGRPPPPKPATDEDTRARAEAFERMRPNAKKPAPTSAYAAYSGSGTSGAAAGSRGRSSDSRQPPTASQQRKSEAAFGTRPQRSSRSGFVNPGTPMGDEPPVPGKNYINKRHTSLFNEIPSTSRRSRPSQSAEETADPSFVDPFLDPRQSSPYRAHIGEKLDPFDGVHVGRTKSTRESSRRVDDDGVFSPGAPRQRSFSMADELDSEDPARSPADARRSSATPRASRAPSNPSASRFAERYSPKPSARGGNDAGGGKFEAEDNAARNDSSPSMNSAGATVGQDNGHDRHARRHDKPSEYEAPRPSVDSRTAATFDGSHQTASSGKPKSAPEPTASQQAYTKARPEQSARFGPRLSSESSATERGQELNAFERQQLELLRILVASKCILPDKRRGSSRPSRAAPRNTSIGSSSSSNNSKKIKIGNRQEQTDKNAQSSFHFSQPRHEGADPDAAGGQHRFARNSADNINTRFVAEEHLDTNWQFNAGGDIGKTPNGSSVRRSQSGAPLGRRSPTKGRAAAQSPRPGGGRGGGVGLGISAAAAAAAAAVATDETPNGSPAARFNAEVWSDQIGSEHFRPVPQANSTSPTRASRGIKKRPVRVTKGGTAGMVDEDDTTSGEERVPAGYQHGGPDSPNAMDIDPPMGEPPATPQTPAANGVRGVPVEPSRPEWRAGDANGRGAAPSPGPDPATAATPSLGQGAKLGPGTVDGPAVNRVREGPKRSGSSLAAPQFNTNNAAGSEDTDELRTGFGDFRNVEPFAAPTGTGLDSLGGLKTHLPFDSRAAAQIHLEKPKRKKETKSVEFPRPPEPPRIPTAFSVPHLLPSTTNWVKYKHEFDAYLLDWAHFNSKFLDHMLARHESIKELKDRGGLTSWGNKRGIDAIEEYHDGLQIDMTVHEKWTAYTREHERHVADYKVHLAKMEGKRAP